METGMHIGSKVDANGAAPELAAAVVSVLGAIAQHHIDRETGLKALEVVGMTAGVHGVTVSNCTINGGCSPAPYAAPSFEPSPRPMPFEPMAEEDD